MLFPEKFTVRNCYGYDHDPDEHPADDLNITLVEDWFVKKH